MSENFDEITIRNCVFAFKCTAKWFELDETEDENVMFCQQCQREVHYCSSDEELVKAIKRNQCVGIDSPYSPHRLIGSVLTDQTKD